MSHLKRCLSIALMTTFFAGTFITAEAGSGSEYLPLTLGKKWVLRSATTEVPIVFEVLDKQGESYRLKFDNPWANSELMITPKSGKYYVTAVTMQGQTASLPDGTVYWDFTAPAGAKWSNQIGTMTVVRRDKIVQAGDRTYNDVVQIHEVGRQGSQLYWAFAPGVGFVQFGEGEWAFYLDSSPSRTVGTKTPASPMPTPTTTIRSRGGPLIGLQANIFANEPLTPQTANAHYQTSLEAGITFQAFDQTWAILEPRPGKYDFNELDFQVEQAVRSNVPIAYNVRIVDTGHKSVPGYLQHRGWRDAQMRDRLIALINALVPRFKGRLKWIMIGNEIDPYFAAHPNEAADYSGLFAAGASRFRELVPGVRVSTTVTFDGLRLLDSLLKPLFDQSDFLSVTYYPMNPDFTFRDPDTAGSDFSRMISAAHGKEVILQEVGYASSPLNNSSEEKQARFFENVFRQLAAHRGVIVGANFLFMSDFSDTVVADLARYYNLANAERFKSFLKTLGMFDDKGRPKKSWEVFRQQASRMKLGRD